MDTQREQMEQLILIRSCDMCLFYVAMKGTVTQVCRNSRPGCREPANDCPGFILRVK